jgi:archaetidylinositol phosphate synthase
MIAMERRHLALTAKVEAKILDFLVAKLPSWASPDFLTITALLSAILGSIFYILCAKSLNYLLAINFLIGVHWFADSLDGRVARYRKISRPQYGYYIDHLLDSASISLLVGGVTASAITQTTAGVWILALMLISLINCFLKARIFNVFELSISRVGPTEARLILIIANTLVFLSGDPLISIFNQPVKLMDIFFYLTAAILLAILIPEITRTAVKLDKEDRSLQK